MSLHNHAGSLVPASLRVRGLAVLAAGVIGLLLAFLGMAFAASARADTADAGWRPKDITQGSLILRSGDGVQPAPLLHTDVQMQIAGLVARVRVQQRFRNPGDGWAEGIYVFPLPEDAAVDHMDLRIGERRIAGQIKERAEAKRTYQQAARSGRKASLVEQERPNIFTTSVANIAPGEEVAVEIEYQQNVRYDAGLFSLRFPMVVGPRYIPGAPVEQGGEDGGGWSADTAEVADASRITPPVRHPKHGPINPVRLDIELDAGVPLERVASPYHSIHSDAQGPGRYRVTLAGNEVPADRDFVLEWRARASAAPQSAGFIEHKDGEYYVSLMLLPPLAAEQTAPTPREAVFVIDVSGSMQGASIDQAKQALLLALGRLKPHDRFNVIRFNHTTGSLYPEPQPATPENLARAKSFVNALYANGGTEMAAALRAALAGQTPAGYLRQVVFLTDGAVGNEDALFGIIRAGLGASRLFTVGIGSAPNSHFMRTAADYGRGTFTYIGAVTEVRTRMEELFRKLERPALTDIQVAWPPGVEVEAWPGRVPDLYIGEPLTISARLRVLPDSVAVRGRFAGKDWQSALRLADAQPHAGVAVLWARRKIEALSVQLREAQDQDAVRKSIVEVALRHHLVSAHTSLVAVDVTPVRADGDALHTRNLPTNLPHGWNYEAVFGGLPQTATAAQLHSLIGAMLLLLAGLFYLLRRRAA
ncbi:MAG: marine proteobacterial sortase target protein [Gammaproteobacteria bacterium]|nr:marine proteobacterial sortase target protein [Gammaproteobacteria bacterium]